MKYATTICLGLLLVTGTVTSADAFRAASGPRGGVAVAGPRGAAVRGPGGGGAAVGRYGGAAGRGPAGDVAGCGGYGRGDFTGRCVALLVMSRFAAATAGHITAAGMVRVLSLPVLPWGRQRVLQPHRRPTILPIRIIIRRLIKLGFPGWIGS